MRKPQAFKPSRFGEGAYLALLAGLAVALLFLFAITLSLGRYPVPLDHTVDIILSQALPMNETWTDLEQAVVLTQRLPRALAAMVIGAALALSGAVYQSVFKNPMCSPDLLGVSSGACVGASLAILAGSAAAGIQACAFAGGIIAVLITTAIPHLIRSRSTTILILSGIIVGSFLSSIMNVIRTFADTDTQLAEITYWTMGSFANASIPSLLTVLPTIVIPSACMLAMSYRLNVLSLGDQEASSLGVNISLTRGLFILCATLVTASSVCLCGTIGWVGLVIPHIARMMAGVDNKRMLPVALVSGAMFMLVIDLLCRTLSTAELRVGILTGIIGAPFFLLILIKQHRSMT